MITRTSPNVGQTAEQKIVSGLSIYAGFHHTHRWSLMHHETSRIFFGEIGKFFFLPINAVLDITFAIFAWRDAIKSPKQNSLFARAGIETVVAVLSVIAVVGTLVAAAVFGTIAPFLQIAAGSLRMLFLIGNAINFAYDAYQAHKKGDEAEYEKNIKLARVNGIATFANVCAIVSITLVIVLAKPLYAFFGMAAGVIGVGLAIYRVSEQAKPKPPMKIVQTEHEDEKTLSKHRYNHSTQLGVKAFPQAERMQSRKKRIVDWNYNVRCLQKNYPRTLGQEPAKGMEPLVSHKTMGLKM